jgi:hypothetical protein
MRLLLTTLLLAVLMPMTAAADEHCSSWTVEHQESTPILSQEPDSYRGFRVAMVGYYLWVSFDDGEILSVAIPEDAIGITVCADGNVTFKSQPVETETTHKPHPVEETTINLLDYWQGKYNRFY